MSKQDAISLEQGQIEESAGFEVHGRKHSDISWNTEAAIGPVILLAHPVRVTINVFLQQRHSRKKEREVK